MPDSTHISQNAVVHIVGAGLAGSEAAFALAQCGIRVVLHEMRPTTLTPAHQTGWCAELVCSNSFRSDDWEYNAVGLLHAEMRVVGSLILRAADASKVPAGAALAVDREAFARTVTHALHDHPLITTEAGLVSDWPEPGSGHWIFATGPLTAPDLAQAIQSHTRHQALAFFDAIAPIVHRDSINFDIAWMQSRYDKEGPGGDKAAYINCPMNKRQYEDFVAALIHAPKTEFKEWEKDTPYFEGCLPIEVMAERGVETLRHGPMKPVGLTNPRTGKHEYAIVQLRQDNRLGTLWNMVGFQTKLRHGAQSEIFRMIPGLENAEFARLGGIHRNAYIDSPRLLDKGLRLRSHPHIRFAGQITGVEGYVESAAMGWLAGIALAAELLGLDFEPPPPTTAFGALLDHITGGHLANPEPDRAVRGMEAIDASVGTSGGGRVMSFQPMNINYGLFPPSNAPLVDDQGKKLPYALRGRARKKALSERALSDLAQWYARQVFHTKAQDQHAFSL